MNRDECSRARLGRLRALASLLLLLLPPFSTFLFAAEDNSRRDEAFFENKIRPLLVENCVKCHGSKKQESNLRVDTRDSILKGGDSGAAAVAGKPDASLIARVLRHDGDIKMPPDGKLGSEQIRDVETWILRGLPWPRDVRLAGAATSLRGGPITERERQFWSFQPIADPRAPVVRQTEWALGDIDRFVLARLESSSMRPADDADRRSWIRRATLDLTGLPPKIADVESFVADTSREAHAKVIDRLLDSTAYGERWGRHWLDLVRYADTAGETADYPVREAYLYRNWVFRAFNEDLPYDRFLREQIAGDLMARDLAGDKQQLSGEALAAYRRMVTATGFIAISRRFGFDPQNYHHLTIQDTIDTIGQAVLGLSLGCARCHDHKYDPINRGDYYSLYGIFESTKYAFPGSEQKKRPADFVPALPPRLAEAHRKTRAVRLKELADKLAAVESRRKSVSAALKQKRKAAGFRGQMIDHLMTDAFKEKRFFHLYRPTGAGLPILGVNVSDKPIKVPGTAPPRGVVVHPDTKFGVSIAWRSPFDGEVGVSGRVADAHHFGDSVSWNVDVIRRDGLTAISSGAIGVAQAQQLKAGDQGERLARLPVKSGDFIQLAVFPKTNIGADLTSIELRIVELRGAKRVWNLADDIVSDLHDGGRGNPHRDAHGNPDVWYFYKLPTHRGVDWISGSKGNKKEKPPKIDASLANLEIGALIKRRDEINGQIDQLKKAQAAEQIRGPYPVLYAVADGAGKNARIHVRGNQKELGDEAPRRHLEILGNDPLPKNESGSGRRQLAQWLTKADNPLTARVMVNRIWQHHFGEGLVRTENDFGARGEAPSHPRLLDWLATRFRKDGWSIKKMHRLILNSRAYRMSSAYRADYAERDPDNRLLWRFSRRRLSAEELRDSVLAISGELDRSMGGAHPFPPVESWGFTQHAPFYAVYPTKRRSVYLMQQRLKRHPFLSLFDGADPNVATAQRVLTTTPTQALFLMNNPFIHEQSEAYATRLLAAEENGPARIAKAFRDTLSRKPSDTELKESAAFIAAYQKQLPADMPADQRERQGLAGFVRTLFIRNGFLFVD